MDYVDGLEDELENEDDGDNNDVDDSDEEENNEIEIEAEVEDGKTEVELIHEDIPDEEAKDIESGWKSYYLGPLKELLEST